MKKSLPLWCALLVSAMCAQTPPALPPVNHDFDFWLGEWEVTTPDGKPAGQSRIEAMAGGHGLLENWEGAPPPGSPAGTNGSSGKSLNAYNPAKKQWQQFWVGGGGVLELAGGLVDGRMILAGSRVLPDGATLINRITWTSNPDGSVRQHWEQSRDGGQTWTTVFDGHYTRKQ